MSTAEASLSGTVTAKSTGEPLSGISVAIFNNSTNKKYTGTTDSNGNYSITSIPVGTYDVEVEGDDYSPTNVDDLSVPAGNTVKNFTMSKGSSSEPGESSSGPTKIKVTGTVEQGEETETGMEGGTIVLQKGGPVSGATVTAKNLNSGAVLAQTTSDNSGNFSLEFNLVSYELIAMKDGQQYATDNVNEESLSPGVIIVGGD